MEQKTILQLAALGTFSFALGIISTLTIQTIVGPQSTPTSSSVSSSEVSSSIEESSLSPQGPWQGFSSEWDVQPIEVDDTWEGLTPEVLETLELDYAGYDIDEVYTFGDEIFVFIEMDILYANETLIDTDIFLFFNPDGSLTREFIFKPSENYIQNANEIFEDNFISDITNDPLPYREGFLFTMVTVASIEIEGVQTEIDGFLSFVAEENTPSIVKGLYYFDAIEEHMYTIEQYDSDVDLRTFDYTDLQVSGSRYLIGRFMYYYQDFEDYYPFDLFEEEAQTNVSFDYASFNPSDETIFLIERFGFYTNRVYVDMYSGWSRTIKGEEIDLSMEKLHLEMLVYIIQDSYDSQDQWFHTINMDLDKLSLTLDEFVEVVDESEVGEWYQIRYDVLFDLNAFEIEHLYRWNDLTDLANSVFGYLAYDFENQRIVKGLYTYRYLELDDVYFGDTTLEYIDFQGNIIHTFDFEGIFEMYYLEQNEYDQFLIAGRTIILTNIEDEDRVVSIGAKVWLLDESFNVLDTIHLSSELGVEIWGIWIYETEIILEVAVNGNVYEGLLEPYSEVDEEGRLSIRIPLIPQTNA